MRDGLSIGGTNPETDFGSAETDQQVAASAQPSSLPSFETLFAQYQPLVYSVARRFLGSPQDAEDVAQEIFTKVWRNLGSFNRNSSLKTWIYRIAVNTCIDYSRKPWRILDSRSERHEECVGSTRPEARFVTLETAEGQLLAEEKAVLMRKAVAHLRPHLKAVFVLKELEELSYDEISSLLGLSMGTISSRLNRAKKALQESLRTLVPRPALAGAGA